MTRANVTVHEGTALRAALSPDGTRIALIVLGTIHVLDRATGVTRVVTDPAVDPEEYDGVAWSPDGTRLAVRRGQWPEALIVIDLATNARHTITTRQFASEALQWDPRRGLVALAERGDSTDVVSYSPTPGGPPAAMARLPRTARWIALSPDGMELAYVTPTDGAYLPVARSRVMTLSLASGGTTPLTQAGGFDGFPAYSPDGSSIAVVSRRDGHQRVWILPRDGTAPRAVSAPEDSAEMAPLSFTPDGQRILFVSRGRLREAPVPGGPTSEVPFAVTFSVARWTGLRTPAVPAAGALLQAQGVAEPVLAPDGREVAFAALGDLWSAPTAGGAPRRLMETPDRVEVAPKWAPDGTRLAYVAAEPGADPRLHVRTMATGADTSFALPAVPEDLAWAPDSRRIAVYASNLIAWMNAASGALTMSGPQAGGVNGIAGWTASSDTVVFWMGAQRDSTLAAGLPRFARLPATTGAVAVPWTPPVPVEAENAAWTRDLHRAAFTIGGTGYWTDITAKAAVHDIPDPTPTDFSWSADGARLGYLSTGRYRVLDVTTGLARTVRIAPSYRAAPAQAPVLIRNVTLIDGTGRPPAPPRDVLLRGGRIARIAPGGTLQALRGTRVVDAAGRTLMPGLIDMHAHFDGASTFGPSPAFLYYGVLSVRDMGSPRGRSVAMRERALMGAALSPRVFTSAGRLSTAFGHSGRDLDYRVAANLDTAGILRAVTAARDAGSDVVKAYYLNYGFHARVSAAAHAVGLPVTGHLTTPGNAFHGIEGHEHDNAGYGNEWTTVWRDDLFAIMRAAGTCVTPTLVHYPVQQLHGESALLPMTRAELIDSVFYPPWAVRLAAEALGTPVPPERRAYWDRYFAMSVANVREMHRRGLRVTAGTDVWPDGLALQWELRLLVLAGLSPLEAIRAATLDAASCLGVEGSLGSIAVGKVADLVLVNGDPATRIEDAAKVEMVFLGGKPLTRSDISARVRR